MAAVHPDRWNTTTTTRKAGVVVHTSESGDGSYESLRRYVEQPGDRQGTSGMYGSAYHALARNDAGATYDEILSADQSPFSAPPVNATWWHFCIPGRAAQSRDEWLDAPSRSGVRAAAKFIVAKARVDGFPLERRTVAELQSGRGGYCGHVDVTWAWRKSTHTDPGEQFPWDVLAADIAELLAPRRSPPLPRAPRPPVVAFPRKDDVMRIIHFGSEGSPDWVACAVLPGDDGALRVEWLDGDRLEVWRALGLAEITWRRPHEFTNADDPQKWAGHVLFTKTLQTVGTRGGSPFESARPDAPLDGVWVESRR